MTIRASILVALALLASGCAFEQGQGDESVVGASSGTSVGTPRAPAVEGDPAAPAGGTGGGSQHHYLPSTQADPCDPDPQPWKPHCPVDPNGNNVKRAPLYLTPTN